MYENTIEMRSIMNIQSKTYLYVINYQRDYKELCQLEMASIFLEDGIDRSLLTHKDIDISRSVFIKGRIHVSYMTDTLEEMIQEIELDELAYEDYKIRFLKYDKVDYSDRLTALRMVGSAIIGDYAMSNFKTDLALTRINNKWIFGIFERDLFEWEMRKKKPYDYANALEIITSRAIVNIAIKGDFTKSLVDVCCGIGTVVIEAKELGLTIKGYELNPLVAQHANQNLLHFGLVDDIVHMDMLDIKEKYDVAILDMPYGLFSLTSTEKQIELIKKTRSIATKAIIISMGDVSDMIKECGFEIVETSSIYKSNALSRIISVCE